MTNLKIEDMPPPPDGAAFQLQKIEQVSLPHPFCITPRHVAFAADHRSGMLTAEAIEASGARCGMRNCDLPYKKHETLLSLWIGVPKNTGLNDIPLLNTYLLANKSKFEAMGIQGFAFPTL